MADQKVSVGRIVHYVIDADTHRPAMVVRVWPEQPGGPYEEEASKGEHVVQLQVFTDGSNDKRSADSLGICGAENGLVWRTSVHYDPNGEPGTWHWPERV